MCCFLVFEVLEIKLRALCTLGKCSVTVFNCFISIKKKNPFLFNCKNRIHRSSPPNGISHIFVSADCPALLSCHVYTHVILLKPLLKNIFSIAMVYFLVFMIYIHTHTHIY